MSTTEPAPLPGDLALLPTSDLVSLIDAKIGSILHAVQAIMLQTGQQGLVLPSSSASPEKFPVNEQLLQAVGQLMTFYKATMGQIKLLLETLYSEERTGSSVPDVGINEEVTSLLRKDAAYKERIAEKLALLKEIKVTLSAFEIHFSNDASDPAVGI
ncbi:hypothetical protein H696_01360 [Fonticula alba]|uniref:Uncharacterized protein n=1 Tax=Fonticula alba TaxID=691883 RepID=A0A058ZDD8_FONAL|nr:hypothetical protein H696_01360 [Fonticula alba]KCV71951.1 hypothetical protein H696_01360 [Fonticula alba]|eukprot:XP_009493529.1 hypothetical protein H696_01360 [Fonticula alba]